MAQTWIHPMVCTLATRLQALAGLRNLFPPVVGLAPDPAGFASYRKSYTGQNQRGRALDFVAKSQVASKAAARLLDKIGTDNWGERLVFNGFVVDDDCFLTASWRTRHPNPTQTPNEPAPRTCQWHPSNIEPICPNPPRRRSPIHDIVQTSPGRPPGAR